MGKVATAQVMLDEQELMRLLLAKYRLKECASLMGVAYPTICARARRPEFLEKLKELAADIYEELDHELKVVKGAISERMLELSNRALDRLEAIMDDENTDKRLLVKVSQDFLDRTPATAKNTKSTQETNHTFANPLVLVAAAAAAREMDQSNAPPMLEAQG